MNNEMNMAERGENNCTTHLQCHQMERVDDQGLLKNYTNYQLNLTSPLNINSDKAPKINYLFVKSTENNYTSPFFVLLDPLSCTTINTRGNPFPAFFCMLPEINTVYKSLPATPVSPGRFNFLTLKVIDSNGKNVEMSSHTIDIQF